MEVGAVDHRDRHLCAVVGGRPQQSLRVGVEVDGAEHGLPFEHGVSAVCHAVGVEHGGCGHRGEEQADARLGELGIACRQQRSGLPAEGQLLHSGERRGGLVVEPDDSHSSESASAVADGDEVGEGVDVFDAQTCDLGDHRPRVRGGVGGGNVDEFEVGAVAVMGDEEPVLTADHGVLDAVLDPLFAWPDGLRFGLEVIGADAPVAGGGLRPGDDE